MNEEKNIYDMTVLLASEDEGRIKSLIKKHGGENVSDIRPLTKINLAYPVKKHQTAFMAAIGFSMDTGSLLEFKSDLKDESDVLRHLILKSSGKIRESAGDRMRRAVRRPKKEVREGDFVSNEDLEEKIKEME